jgi:hypothetical protein
MQPLPSTITSKLLFDSADGFTSAAKTLGSADSAATLARAASLAYQGIPSLLMTTTRDSGSRELAQQLRDAAAAAQALAKEIQAAPAGTDFSARRDAVLGWANLAADAAFLVPEPLAFA